MTTILVILLGVIIVGVVGVGIFWFSSYNRLVKYRMWQRSLGLRLTTC